MIIVDYGIGNIGSIINMFKKIGVKAEFTSNKDKILNAEKLLLPGVGAFDHGMKTLRASGLIEVLEQKALIDNTPILGICLGMQLLLEGSEEGVENGLGWIKGKCKRFQHELKIPHMGWNRVIPKTKDGLFSNMDDELRYYFVHSYHAEVADENILTMSHYGYDFVSGIVNENIFGVQFHPEKSHKFGMELLKNFAGL